MGEKTRFTLDLDRPFQRQLKVAAAQKGVSMRAYCIDAIERQLLRDEIARGPRFTMESIDRLTHVRDEVFYGRTLPGDSAEYIREAREIRDRELWGG